MGLAACEVFGFLYACVTLDMFCSAQSNFRSGLSVVLVLALSFSLCLSLSICLHMSLSICLCCFELSLATLLVFRLNAVALTAMVDGGGLTPDPVGLDGRETPREGQRTVEEGRGTRHISSALFEAVFWHKGNKKASSCAHVSLLAPVQCHVLALCCRVRHVRSRLRCLGFRCCRRTILRLRLARSC